MADEQPLRVYVLYALPECQVTVAVDLRHAATAADAVRASGLLERFSLDWNEASPLGLYGQVIESSRRLAPGDRIEILRPLRHDPREIRRRLAAEGRTMGRRRR